MSGRKVAKRACDGCKIRKIKCTEVSPCEGCIAAGIACTFVKHPQTRGPRRLRKSTLQEITRTQQQWADSGLTATAVVPPDQGGLTSLETVFAPSQIASLVLQLCVYRLRMYPVWPIIKIERLVASLQGPDPDIEVFALAYAVAAATIAQIKPAPSSRPDNVTAEMMESRCQHARRRCNKSAVPNITTLRISFFLHIYYENQLPGGLQSILYLREAITMSQMLGLHRESYYVNVAQAEQQIRRRTFWLLFITERGVSVLHKLPVILKTSIAFPSTDDSDEADVLIAFQKLITLFWTFDQSGVFEVLDRADFDMTSLDNIDASDPKMLESLSQNLARTVIQTDEMNDVQAVDISVTRQWMRVILWRLTQNHGLFAAPFPVPNASLYDPVQIAKEFLAMIAHMPSTAIEAHGPGLELKVFEMASSVVDAWSLGSASVQTSDAIQSQVIRSILGQLRKLLARNKKLDTMLGEKMAKAEQSRQGTFDFSLDNPSHPVDSEIEQQLQSHGCDFSQSIRASTSPHSDSITSDVSYYSPAPAQIQLNPTTGQSPFHYHSENWEQEQSFEAGSQEAAWDSVIRQSSGPGFNVTPEIFNQLRGFDPGFETFGVDTSLESGEFNGSNWPADSPVASQPMNSSPVESWQPAREGAFHN